MQSVEKYLKELHSILPDAERLSSLLNPIQIIQDLNDVVSKISTAEIGLCSNILFDEELGIFSFVDKSLSQYRNVKVMSSARKASFDFVLNYVKLIQHRIAEHALLIKKWCLNIFRREESNTVKESTLQLLMKILRFDFPFLNAETLQVKEMFDIFLKEFLKSKSSSTVKGSLLQIIGMICEYFPSATSIKSQQVLQLFMDTLQTQSTKSDPDSILVSSCFKGLSHFLISFGISVTDTGEFGKFVKPFYSFLCKALELTNVTRYDVPKAALQFLGKQGIALQFKEYLTVDAENMFKRLELLCDHKNEKVRKAAFPAVEAFLAEVAYELTQKNRNTESNMRTYKSLMYRFKLLLDQKLSSKYALSLAIRSFGQFAAPMKVFSGQEDTKLLLLRLFKFADQLLGKNQEELEEYATHIPSFIAAFANIILELDRVDSWIIDHLEKIIGVLFLIFPKHYLFSKYKLLNYTSLLKLFISLYIKQNSLETLLSRILFYGITLTISSSTVLAQDNSADRSVPFYEQYFDLWNNLFDENNLKLSKWNYPWSDLSFSTQLVEHFYSVLYNKMMECILDIVNKLDLQYSIIKDDGEAESTLPSDVLSKLKPHNGKDFELFLNMVEFCSLFVKSCKSKHFIRWSYLFSKLMIEKSYKYPFISGFYKLLTVAMSTCDRYGLFAQLLQNKQSTESDEKSLETELFSLDRKTLLTYFQLILSFSRHVNGKFYEFKGELLAAAVKLILSLPKEFITNLKLFTNSLRIALEIGLSYLPIASVALDTLDHWIRILPLENLQQECFPIVMPLLEQFLLVQSNEEEDTNQILVKKTNQSKTSIDKTIVEAELSRKKLEEKLFSDVEKITLSSIQIKIARILGKMGGYNKALLDANKSVAFLDKHVISWDSEKRIQFILPFRDIKTELYLDSLLPRVIELAEKSGDRAVKIAACELLHSLMIFMIGKNAISPTARTTTSEPIPTPFYKIYKRVFPVILKLATDTEQVSKQLFESLVYQMVHWFTKNMMFENKETIALLDSIIDGLAGVQQQESSALRELCTDLLNEFLRWSLKHDRNSTYVNVRSLFQRLYSNMNHPNLQRRLGSILAFNKMYRTIRENDEVLDKHLLDIFHNTFVSLKMTSYKQNEKPLIDRIIELIGHLEKIVIHKSTLLNKTNMDRTSHICLEDFVSWIFTQCGSREEECRVQSMKLFSSLSVQLPNFGTEDGPRRWISSFVQRKGMSELFELISHIKSKISIRITLEEFGTIESVQEIIQWFTDLETVLSVLTWLFTHNLVAPHSLLPFQVEYHSMDEDVKKMKKTKKEESETVFKESVGSLICKQILVFFKDYSEKQLDGLSPMEEDTFVRKKSTFCASLITFLNLMIDKFPETFANYFSVENQKLYSQFVGYIILQPFKYLSFDEPIQVFSLAKNSIKAIQSSKLSFHLASEIKEIIESNYLLNIQNLDLNEFLMNVDDIAYLIRGYQLLLNYGLLDRIIELSLEDYAKELILKIFSFKSNMNPNQIFISKELFSFCTALGLSSEFIVNQLLEEEVENTLISQQMSQLDESTISTKNQRVKLSTKGEKFYQILKSEINRSILQQFEAVVQPLFQVCMEKDIALRMLVSVAESCKRTDPKSVTVIKESTPYLGNLLLRYFAEKHNAFSSNDLAMLDATIKLCDAFLSIHSNSFFEALSAENSKRFEEFIGKCLELSHNSFTGALDHKLRCLRMVPKILSSSKAEELQIVQKITENLKTLIVNDFPISFKDIQSNSILFEAHVDLLQEVLSVFEQSASLELFGYLLPLYRWIDHPLKDKMSASLKKFINNANEEKLLLCSNRMLQLIFDESYPPNVRKAIMQWPAMIVLKEMKSAALIQFFETHIVKIANVIINAAKFNTTASAEEITTLLVSRICAFNLLEAMFRLLPATVIKVQISQKFQAAQVSAKLNQIDDLGKVIIKAADTACQAALDPVTISMIDYNYVLDFYAASYSTLAGAIKCTQVQEKIFSGFLFKKRNWENLVNLKKEYDFPIETNFALFRKAIDQLRISAVDIPSEEKLFKGEQKLRYLSSQYLADSSLNEGNVSYSSFFVAGSKLGRTTNVDDSIVQVSTSEVYDQTLTDATEKDSDALELDEINLNPCMPAILRVIDFLTKQFPISSASTMPEWMSVILEHLSDKMHQNVKIFFAKVLINRPKVFEPFSQQFFKPIVELIISKNNGGKGIHYFVRDLCCLLLKWKQLLPPDTEQGKQLATSLVSFLMRFCSHQKKFILKSNLELVKFFVEKYINRISIRKDLILGWLCHDPNSPDSKLAKSTGLQLLGIVLTNNIPCYDASLDAGIISEERYFDKILENLHSTHKEVYEATAEIAGMILNQLVSKQVEGDMTDTEHSSYGIFVRKLFEILNNFYTTSKYDKFLISLNKVAKNHAPFLDQFLPSKILDILPNLFGNFKHNALQIINWRCEFIPDIYQGLKPFLKPLLSHKEEPSQLLILQILFKLMKLISKQDLLYFFNVMQEIYISDEVFVSIFPESCRDLYYNLLIWLYDNRADVKQDVDQFVRLSLLRGMADPSENIRKKILQFWDVESRLIGESMGRLEQLFSVLYSSKLQNLWVQYSSYLLLELSSRSPDFENSKFIFGENLADCEFKEYNIDTSLRAKSNIMTPLFSLAPSGMGLSLSNNVVDEDVTMGNTGEVKATQGYQFTPTQFGMTTISSLLADPSLSQTSLLFTPFKKTNNTTTNANGGTLAENTEELKVKRRFHMLKESVLTQQHIKRAVRLKKEREAWETRHKLERRAKVTMYRKYRSGELPDIQIAIKEFVQPLQALVLGDSMIAKSVFELLFNAIYPGMFSKFDIKISQAMVKSITQKSKEMLLESNSPTLISTILTICFQNASELLSSNIISSKDIELASKRSNNLELGAVVVESMLERVLIPKYVKPNRLNSFKPTVGSVTQTIATSAMDIDEEIEQPQPIEESEDLEEMWVTLVKLYKELGEDSVVESISEVFISQSEISKLAIQYEQVGNYNSAAEQYQKALTGYDDNAYEKSFWKNQLLHCYSNLCSWSKLASELDKEIMGSVSSIWKSPLSASTIVPMLFDSYLGMAEKETDKLQVLNQFINESFEDLSLRAELESSFAPYMAATSLHSKQHEKARSYAFRHYLHFIQEWTTISPLSTTKDKLLNHLQQALEIEEFVNLLNTKPFKKPYALEQLILNWSKRFPNSKLDSIVSWNELVRNRKYMIDMIKQMGEAFEVSPNHSNTTISQQPNLEDFISTFEPNAMHQIEESSHLITNIQEKCNSLLEETLFAATSASLEQGNHIVAKRYLQLVRTVKPVESFTLHKQLSEMLRVHFLQSNNSKQLDQLIGYLETKEPMNSPKHKLEWLLLKANANRLLSEHYRVSHNSNLYYLNMEQSIKLYSEAIRYSQQNISASSEEEQRLMGQTMITYANFCFECLEQNPVKSEFMELNPNYLAVATVTNTLQSMHFGEAKARKYFPRCLGLIEKYANTRFEFSKQAKQVPLWMFINWISQMIPHLNHEEGICIVELLEQLADQYPQAIYYPLYISAEDLNPVSQEVKQSVEVIKKKIQNPLLTRFIYELDRMTEPSLRFKDFASNLKTFKQDGLEEQFKKEWNIMTREIFERGVKVASNYQKIADTMAPKFKQAFPNVSHAYSMELKDFANKMQELFVTMSKLEMSNTKLASYSPWLADFQQAVEASDEYIEIPGQYFNVDRPLRLEEHVHITSFGASILTMSSIRKPKRLTMYGDDEKEYHFLVKGGEDLRQDQRIEQLFLAMNQIFSADMQCIKHRLAIRTYTVIPMSKSVGVLEWVNNTIPLKSVIEGELSKRTGKKEVLTESEACKILRSPIVELASHYRLANARDQYLKLFEKKSRAQIVQLLHRAYDALDPDLLKHAIQKLSRSPEAYYTLRNRFARSLAVTNICQYVLGIGDRHLDNFLLDTSLGELVAIDFGHAFGSATDTLPVPELMPFRLTRQLLHVVVPLAVPMDQEYLLQHGSKDGVYGNLPVGSGALLFDSMVTSMNALHQHRDVLLSTMDVFIKEPLVDWLKNAKMEKRFFGESVITGVNSAQSGEQGSSHQETTTTTSASNKSEKVSQQSTNSTTQAIQEHKWYPARKIQIAREKLEMANPAYITLKEVKNNMNFLPAIKLTEKVIKGVEGENIRASVPEKCSSIKEQIQCLVDQATDGNILGRTWIGWGSFC